MFADGGVGTGGVMLAMFRAVFFWTLLVLLFSKENDAEVVVADARVTVEAKSSVAQLKVFLRLRNDGVDPVRAVSLAVPAGSSGFAAAFDCRGRLSSPLDLKSDVYGQGVDLRGRRNN